ncbi:MAG: Holliday junction resolvase RuvX [Gammaproteobacteria bacterium]
MPKASGTYLSFDFGTKKIGVAVGQTLTKTATPLPKISAKNPSQVWEHIAKLIQEWQPIALVVGLPLNMDGTEQRITTLTRTFINELKNRFQKEVYEVDERLTTRAARSDIFDSGGYKALQKNDIDSIAAKIILESWLGE